MNARVHHRFEELKSLMGRFLQQSSGITTELDSKLSDLAQYLLCEIESVGNKNNDKK